jgi:hypothetical protein
VGLAAGTKPQVTNAGGNGVAVSDYIDFTPWVGVGSAHYLTGVTSAVNSSKKVRWRWKAGSASTTATQLNNAVSTWDARGYVNFVATTTNLTLEVEELYDTLGDYAGTYNPWVTPRRVIMNTYAMSDNTAAEIEQDWTHELGHALGLDHSYIGNIMYYTLYGNLMTTLGVQDISDYAFCWASGTNCPLY